MTPHPLQQRIDALRSRVVRLLAIRGLSVMVASVLATAMVLGCLDYWVRFRDRGVLVVFALAVLGVFAWTACRVVRRLLVLNARLGDTEVALRVEACFPAVKDRLASAVEFLAQPEDDAMAGSAAMRRAAISQAAAASADLDFGLVLDRRPALRSAMAALVVVVFAACLTASHAAATRTALTRLAFPLGTADWPQRTHLGLRQPAEPVAIVRGQPLEVKVIDTGDAPLPADCRIHYRLTDALGRMRVETEPMQLVGEVMLARRENVTAPLEFCFTGGDDRNMNWIEVRVIDPPVVRDLMLTVSPPEYTNWPEEQREATSTRPLLAGSRVQIAGKATKRLKPASILRFDDGRELPLEIDDDGQSFHVGKSSSGATSYAPLIVEKSIGYTLRLIDGDGVEGGGENWQFRVLADAPPSVAIEQPAGDLFVTERAIVSFRVRARDDIALRQVSLVLSRSDATGVKEETVALHAGPEKPPPSSLAAFDAGRVGEEQTIEHAVDCAEFPADFQLSPGMQLTCQAVAADYHAQTGRSDPRVLRVITPDQLLERMAVRQSQLLAELARVLELQRKALSQVHELEIRLHESAGLEQKEIERLQATEFNQREVARSLTGRSDGLPMLVEGLLADLKSNRVDNLDFQHRLEGLLAEFERLQREHLPPIATELTAAIKGSLVRLQSAPRPAGRDAESESHLIAAGEHQQQVIASLEGLLDGMRQWDDYRRFHREVAQLLRDQEETARNTTVLGRLTVGRDLKELKPEELADLKVLAERQFELARRETRLEEEMERTVPTLGQSDPLAAGTLTDAVAEARRLAIAADMSAAGGKIRDNGLGLAPADQQKVLQNLQEVLDILANNRRQELTRLVRKLGDADKDLEALLKRQEELGRKIEEIMGPPGSKVEKQWAEFQKLAREQEELRQQAQQLARRLERLMADEAAKAADKAAGQMDQARRNGEAGDRGGASGSAKQAEDALKDAVQKLRQKRFEIEAQLALEQQARLQDTIKYLQQREDKIAVETREFADIARGGALSRAQDASLLELAHQQDLLRDETGRVAQALDPANIFRLALSAAVDEMGRVAALLQRRQTGPATQQSEQSAIDRLKLMLVAMEPEKPDEQASGGGAGNPGDQQGGPQGGPPPGGVLPLAQLKLLKLLQEDLNLRTQRLDQALAAGKATEDLRDQYARLEEEQGRLAELTFQLLRPQAPDNGEPADDLNQPTEPKEKQP